MIKKILFIGLSLISISCLKSDHSKVLERYSFFFKKYTYKNFHLGMLKKDLPLKDMRGLRKENCNYYSRGICTYSFKLDDFHGDILIFFEQERISAIRFNLDETYRYKRDDVASIFSSIDLKPRLLEKGGDVGNIQMMSDYNSEMLSSCDKSISRAVFCNIEDCGMIYIYMPLISKKTNSENKRCDEFLVQPYIQFQLGRQISDELS